MVDWWALFDMGGDGFGGGGGEEGGRGSMEESSAYAIFSVLAYILSMLPGSLTNPLDCHLQY